MLMSIFYTNKPTNLSLDRSKTPFFLLSSWHFSLLSLHSFEPQCLSVIQTLCLSPPQ